MLDIGQAPLGGLQPACEVCSGSGRVTTMQTVYVPDPVKRFVSHMQRVPTTGPCLKCHGTGTKS